MYRTYHEKERAKAKIGGREPYEIFTPEHHYHPLGLVPPKPSPPFEPYRVPASGMSRPQKAARRLAASGSNMTPFFPNLSTPDSLSLPPSTVRNDSGNAYRNSCNSGNGSTSAGGDIFDPDWWLSETPLSKMVSVGEEIKESVGARLLVGIVASTAATWFYMSIAHSTTLRGALIFLATGLVAAVLTVIVGFAMEKLGEIAGYVLAYSSVLIAGLLGIGVLAGLGFVLVSLFSHKTVSPAKSTTVSALAASQPRKTTKLPYNAGFPEHSAWDALDKKIAKDGHYK